MTFSRSSLLLLSSLLCSSLSQKQRVIISRQQYLETIITFPLSRNYYEQSQLRNRRQEWSLWVKEMIIATWLVFHSQKQVSERATAIFSRRILLQLMDEEKKCAFIFNIHVWLSARNKLLFAPKMQTEGRRESLSSTSFWTEYKMKQ